MRRPHGSGALEVLDEVLGERANQTAKWGEQNHHPERWLAILMEEVGEAAEAALDDKYAHMRAELVQVAAVAVATIQSLDRNELRK